MRSILQEGRKNRSRAQALASALFSNTLSSELKISSPENTITRKLEAMLTQMTHKISVLRQ